MDKLKARACLKGAVVASLSLMLTSNIASAGQGCGEEISERYDGGDDENDLLGGVLVENKTRGGKTEHNESEKQKRNNSEQKKLRKEAIKTNYDAIVDTSAGGGYGFLYGPNSHPDQHLRSAQSDGRIAGDEYLKFEEEDCSQKKVTMMVQIPKGYDPEKGCIVAAASPASRGIYGAIAIAEWGLKHNCAMAFTDKGTGVGAHDLDNDTVNLIGGERGDASNPQSNFTAALTSSEREKFKGQHLFAVKHAHSQQNPEKDWGKNVLRAAKYALAKLDEKYGSHGKITKANTTIIAASISNGGGAVLRAVEEDKDSLIDGVVAWEPNVTPRVEGRPFTITQDNKDSPHSFYADRSKPMLDYATLINVYQGCANLTPANQDALSETLPQEKTKEENKEETKAEIKDEDLFKARCDQLRKKGLLKSDAPAAQANEAQQKINAFGLLPEQNFLQATYWNGLVPQALSATYANSYGRFGAGKTLCGYSFGAAQNGNAVALSPENEAKLFAKWDGLPRVADTNTIGLIGGNGQNDDQRLAAALCLRSLIEGQDAAANNGPLSKEQAADAAAIKTGMDQIIASGDLHGTPAIIVTGRSDAIIAPNLASRAYYAVNHMVEPSSSNLRYYEVTNAQHLDAANFKTVFDKRYVPLYYYFLQSMDLMFERLNDRKSLPPSQVVRTKPRILLAMHPDQTNALSDQQQGENQSKVAKITKDNVPPINPNPTQAELITFTGTTLKIPE